MLTQVQAGETATDDFALLPGSGLSASASASAGSATPSPATTTSGADAVPGSPSLSAGPALGTGLPWTSSSATPPFGIGAILAVAGTIVLASFRRRRRRFVAE
jgi:hypothetical protein